MIAGPAYSDAAEPVSTKMPAPMIAPIPRVTRFTGPRARLRLCSPVAEASFIRVSSDFVANKGLPMQLLLCEGRIPAAIEAKLDLPIVGVCPDSPYNKFLGVDAGFITSTGPQPVHRQPQQHNHQAPAGGLGSVEQQHEQNHGGRNDVQQWNDRVAERLVRTLRIRSLGAQHEYADDGQDIKHQRGENHVVQQIAIKIAVADLSGSINFACAHQNQNDDPDTLIDKSSSRHAFSVEFSRRSKEESIFRHRVRYPRAGENQSVVAS